jgi:hypothetical protein
MGDGCIHVVCIRFTLYDIHRFELPRLSDISNYLSQGRQHIVTWLKNGIIEYGLNYYNYCIAIVDCFSTGCKHEI